MNHHHPKSTKPEKDGTRRTFFTRLGAAVAGIGLLAPRESAAEPTNASELTEGFIGEIRMFGGNFAPRSWALCDGQLLPISQNSALFSILGTTYGGDGRTTFGLPDLRGRMAMHPGRGPGLTARSLGSKGGSETISFAEVKAGNGRGTAAGASSVSNLPPFQCVNYIICLTGIFPSRN